MSHLRDPFIANNDLTAGRRDEAREDLQQRGFSGAVFSRQRMDLPCPKLEAQIVQSAHAGEITSHFMNGNGSKATHGVLSTGINSRSGFR